MHYYSEDITLRVLNSVSIDKLQTVHFVRYLYSKCAVC